MRPRPLFLLALCALCADQALAAAGTHSAAAAAAAPAAPATAAALLQLQRTLARGRPDTAELLKLTKEVTKVLAAQREREQGLPVQEIAEQCLATVTRAVAMASAAPAHRAQLLAERAKLLQAVGAAGPAYKQAEGAAWALGQELSAWAATPEAATPHVPGTPATPSRAAAAAVLQSLLDVTGLLRQLGWEERANAILAEAVRLSPRLPASASYLRAVAQLSELTDEQLADVLSCVEVVEGRSGAAAAACEWMRPALKGDKGVDNLHRLYYAAHRGLHARKLYGEAWRTLVEAKRLHATKHSYKGTDFLHLADTTAARFPLPSSTAPQAAGGREGAAGQQQQPAAQLAAPSKALLQLQAAVASGGAWAKGQVAGMYAWLLSAAAGKGDATGRPPVGDTEVEGGQGGRFMKPIFVLGLPRSGSTLIEHILASHPDVWGAGEISSLRPLAKKLEVHMSATNGSTDPHILAQLRRRYLSGMMSRVPEGHRHSRWMVDKSLQNAWFIGHIAALMPEACIIHSARHPADAALSAFQQSFFPNKVPWSFDLKNIANHVAAHYRMMAHWDALLPGRVLHLHYADMVRDQEGTTRRLIAHCGLPWHPNLLRFYETERAVQTASQLQVRKPIYTSSLSKWPVYQEGLAPLLLELRDTILRYEEQAGLPSSREVLDELAATHAQQANQQSGGTVEEMHDSTGTAATDTAVEGAAGTRREEL